MESALQHQMPPGYVYQAAMSLMENMAWLHLDILNIGRILPASGLLHCRHQTPPAPVHHFDQQCLLLHSCCYGRGVD